MTGDCYWCGEHGHIGHECPKRERLLAKDVPNQTDDGIRQIYNDVVDHFGDAVFVEIGCFLGGSGIYLAQRIQESGKNQKLYCVDIWENTIGIKDGHGVDGYTFHEFWDNVMKSVTEQIIRPIMFDSSRTAQAFEDRSVDFVFIDGDHSFEKCWDDIVSWLPKLKHGGWMAGHDYNGHVERCVEHIFGHKAERILNTCWLVKTDRL